MKKLTALRKCVCSCFRKRVRSVSNIPQLLFVVALNRDMCAQKKRLYFFSAMFLINTALYSTLRMRLTLSMSERDISSVEWKKKRI